MNTIKTFENFNNQDIFTYIYTNDIESVKNYINFGYDLNIQNYIVKLLLDSGADIDKQNNKGYTALTAAASNNNLEVVEFLLDYHADEFILNNLNSSFYDLLNNKNKEYFLNEYPNKVYNAISHWYKKPFTEFVKDFKLKIN